MDGGADRGESGGLGARSEPRDAELVSELAGTVGDRLAHLLGLEQDRLAALRQHFADQIGRAHV